jgi:hypothetical protein
MANPQLSEGVIRKIHETNESTTNIPLLQVLAVKHIDRGQSTTASAHERFVLVVSDGINHQEVMLSTKQNQYVHDGTLKVNCCFRLNSYICDVVQVKKIIIIFDLAVEHPDITQRIGNPVWIDNVHLDLRFLCNNLTGWISKGEQPTADKPWQAYRPNMWAPDMRHMKRGGCWRMLEEGGHQHRPDATVAVRYIRKYQKTCARRLR